jgi:chromosome segregation ATPase
MNERKVKEAFNKVKTEVTGLKNLSFDLRRRLGKVEEAALLSQEVKKEIEKLKELKINEFISKLEKDVDKLMNFISSMEKKSTQTNSTIEKISKKIEVSKTEFEDLKKKFSKTQSESQNTNLELKSFLEQTQEFEQLVNEKVSMEISSLKLEFREQFAQQAQELEKIKKLSNSNKEKELIKQIKEQEEELKKLKKEQRQLKDAFNPEEFMEMLNEKVSLEHSSLRLETQASLAEFASDLRDFARTVEGIKKKSTKQEEAKVQKLNDQVKEQKKAMKEQEKELIKLKKKKEASQAKKTKTSATTQKKKTAPKTSQKKTLTKTQKKENQIPELVEEKSKKEPGRVRKAVKWLFVDDEEEQREELVTIKESIQKK